MYSPLQINLPESVTKRFSHSMSTYYISKSCVWTIVTGGDIESDNTRVPVTGCDVTVIIELGMLIITLIPPCVGDHHGNL